MINRRSFFNRLASGILVATSAELFLPKLIKPVWKPLVLPHMKVLFDPISFNFTPLVELIQSWPERYIQHFNPPAGGVTLEYPYEDLEDVRGGDVVEVRMGTNYHHIQVQGIIGKREECGMLYGKILPPALKAS